MAIRRLIKRGLSFGFQPRRWIGLDTIKSNGRVCSKLLSEYVSEFSGKKDNSNLLIEELDKPSIQHRQRLAICFIILYLLLTVGFVVYAVYLWLGKSFIVPSLMSFLMAFLVLTYALREFMIYSHLRLNGRKIKLSSLFYYLFKGFPS